MFRRISRKLALQCTALMFLLFLINGALFLAADLKNAERQSGFRVARESQMIMDRLPSYFNKPITAIPPPLRDRVRIVDAAGNALYASGLFEDIPFSHTTDTSDVVIDGEHYTITTRAVSSNGNLQGYLQIAEPERGQAGDLPVRALIYLLITILISGLTYLVALFFVRRSLHPAEEMFLRLQQFTQDASHELRTPLTILGSSLDVALKTGTYKEGILSAKEDLHEISILIERLLELAQLDSFTVSKKKIDLSSLVTQTTEKFSLLAKEQHITLKKNIAANIHVQGDEALLRQVISNLLSNALKFNTKKGSISVTLTKHTLKITDTGIGIEKKDLAHIFDRFYQADTSRSEDGYGLGLALVKRIVDLHTWKIDVESTKGKGTAFTLRFSA